jgi:hypothetical protein
MDLQTLEWSAEIEDALLRELRRIHEIETFDPFAGLNVVPVEPAVQPANHRVQYPELSALLALPDSITIEQARTEIPTRLHDYANKKGRSILLVAAPAGIGKSYAGVQFVQERARMGERWYWAAQNHAMFEDLKAQPNFDESLWYHWQPMSGEIDGAPACRFPKAQNQWTQKGYKARALCWQLCGRKDPGQTEEDTYMHKCPFRCQGDKQTGVTFIMHQHLFTGLDDGQADGVIIDEGFISLLAQERHIGGEQIRQGSVNLAIIWLADKLYELWQGVEFRKNKRLSGRELMAEIADLYPDAVAQLQAMRDAEELKLANKDYRNPPVHEAGEVNNLQTIYMDELAAALAPEYRAYQAGMTLWAERVRIDRAGLHYVTTASVWDRMPKKRIVLDASGIAPFIQAVFLRKVEEYRPNVQRQGHIYQAAWRMNHKSGTLDRKRVQAEDGKKSKKYEIDASVTTKDFIRIAQSLIQQRGYKRVAVICNQEVEKFIREGLNLSEAQTMHFYSLRGRNDFKDCDCLFVYGTPTPPERAITNLALALDPRRIDPIYKFDDEGRHIPIYIPVEREFRLSEQGSADLLTRTGHAAASRVVGYYPDSLLSSIQNQLREAELMQAVFRARPITNPADIWIFSSIPLQDIELDGVYDEPPVIDGLPWEMGLNIEDWYATLPHGTKFGYSELSEALNVREDYLRRLDALTRVKEFYNLPIECVCKMPSDGGRPKKGLVKPTCITV